MGGYYTARTNEWICWIESAKKAERIDVSCIDKALDLCPNTVHNETGDMATPVCEVT
jgi:hypothetical protein